MNQIVGIAAALVVALAGWLVRRNVEKLWQIRNLFDLDLPEEPPKRYRVTAQVLGAAAMILGGSAPWYSCWIWSSRDWTGGNNKPQREENPFLFYNRR